MGGNKTCIAPVTAITGASSGIGEALAIESARRGARLFISGRNRQRLEDVARRCRELGATVDATVLDVRDAKAVQEWLEQADSTAPIARVFANAGVATGIENATNVRSTFETNVMGTVNTVLPAIEIFRRRNAAQQPAAQPQILITSSIAGYGPLASCPAYSASKSALKTWALSLRGMLAKESICVSAICPGFVRSRITDANTCPMPFFMEAPDAARLILRRADRNCGIIAFPWPMRFATWGFSILPQWLNELLGRLLPPKN